MFAERFLRLLTKKNCLLFCAKIKSCFINKWKFLLASDFHSYTFRIHFRLTKNPIWHTPQPLFFICFPRKVSVTKIFLDERWNWIFFRVRKKHTKIYSGFYETETVLAKQQKNVKTWNLPAIKQSILIKKGNFHVLCVTI